MINPSAGLGQGWWSRRLPTVHFFPKSKQSTFVAPEGKYQQTI